MVPYNLTFADMVVRYGGNKLPQFAPRLARPPILR